MQLISFFKNTWSRDIKVKERLYFSLVLMALSLLYFYTLYSKKAIVVSELQFEFYVLAGFLFSFVLLDFWGNFILRLWLTVSGLVGQTIFFILLVLVYYLVLSPIFIMVNLFRKKKINLSSNWTGNIYLNKDYQSMG